MPASFFVDSESDTSPLKLGPSGAHGIKQEGKRAPSKNETRKQKRPTQPAHDVEEETKDALRIKLSRLDSEVGLSARQRTADLRSNQSRSNSLLCNSCMRRSKLNDAP
jgi:hypothetical protein